MNHTSDFDLDLKYGEIGEKRLCEILATKKIEVKTERGAWRITGNIAIEYESRGKPSGIAVTKSEWWCTILMDKTEIEHIILTPTYKIIKIAREFYMKGKTVKGGDNNTSKLVLIPIKELIV